MSQRDDFENELHQYTHEACGAEWLMEERWDPSHCPGCGGELPDV